MPDAFDPMEMFKSLGNDAKAAFVRMVVSAFQTVDPGFEKAAEIWRRGKTTRIEALVVTKGGEQNIAVHLVIEAADTQLTRTFVGKAESGTLEFGPGWGDTDGGGTLTGLVASLGMGTLLVREERGELVLSVSRRQHINVPHGLNVGGVLPFGAPEREGFILNLFDGQLIGVSCFVKIQPRETRMFAKSALRVGLVKATKNLLLFCIDLPGVTDGWAEMPFALGVEKPETRRLTPADADGCLSILLALADQRDAKVHAVRTVLLTQEFSSALLTLIEDQQDACEGYTKADSALEYEAVVKRWPTPSHAEKDMICQQRIKAIR